MGDNELGKNQRDGGEPGELSPHEFGGLDIDPPVAVTTVEMNRGESEDQVPEREWILTSWTKGFGLHFL
jgi:hypothetical protein